MGYKCKNKKCNNRESYSCEGYCHDCYQDKIRIRQLNLDFDNDQKKENDN